jgi:ferritin
MLSEKMNKVLNDQINAEMFSSYFYLAMTAWFESQGLSGFASWMRLQTEEEMVHSEKIFNYIIERGGKVELEAIDKPQANWDSPQAVFKDVLEHEEKVTSLINNLVDCALEERDHASNNFLQWFVAEQVEEEASVGAVLDKLKLIKDDSAGLFALDLEMAKRTSAPAA